MSSRSSTTPPRSRASAPGAVDAPGHPARRRHRAGDAYPTTEAGREAHEGELLAPTDTFTVTNVFGTNRTPRSASPRATTPADPADRGRAPRHAGVDAVVADNAARAVTLDDGASIDFLPRRRHNQDTAAPVADARQRDPRGRRGDLRRAGDPRLPQQHVEVPAHRAGDRRWLRGGDVRGHSREELLPRDVGGDIQIGTFNVLNYFNTGDRARLRADAASAPAPTTGTGDDGKPGRRELVHQHRSRGAADWAASSASRPRSSRPSTRWTPTSSSLEEIENSIKVGETDRDSPSPAGRCAEHRRGHRRWAFVPSPAGLRAPARRLAGRHPHRLHLQAGRRRTRSGRPRSWSAPPPSPTRVSRWPRPSSRSARRTPTAFAVIVNHFKSKGDSARRRPATTPTAPGVPSTATARARPRSSRDVRQRVRREAGHRGGVPGR